MGKALKRGDPPRRHEADEMDDAVESQEDRRDAPDHAERS